MKPQLVLLLTLATLLALVPIAAQAKLARSVSHTKSTAAPMYACTICHHQVTAAEAKNLHYTCPVDHGKLLPVKPAAKPREPPAQKNASLRQQ